MHTTWRTELDPGQVLDLLQRRLAVAEDVTRVDRDGLALVVRSRAVPTWAYLLTVVLPPPLPFQSALLRARTDKVLRITALAAGAGLRLDGDANAAVSTILVSTSQELFPDKAAEWDDD